MFAAAGLISAAGQLRTRWPAPRILAVAASIGVATAGAGALGWVIAHTGAQAATGIAIR